MEEVKENRKVLYHFAVFAIELTSY